MNHPETPDSSQVHNAGSLRRCEETAELRLAQGDSRRAVLSKVSSGLTGIALHSLLREEQGRGSEAGPTSSSEGNSSSSAARRPSVRPRASQVIWLMMRGGVSHMESFDPKPELTRHAGKTLSESPHRSILDSPFLRNVREQVANNVIDKTQAKIYPLQVGFQRGGYSGIEISDWWPHVRGCADELAVIRSMWTSDNNHGAQLEFLTGRHLLDGCHPTIGAWVNYGLGRLSDNLPQFVSMGPQLDSQCFGGTDSNYLGPEHAGVVLQIDPENPLPFAKSARSVSPRLARARADLLGQLNQITATEYPADRNLIARMKSYELAFRMQTAIPELLQFSSETAETQQLYGLDSDVTRPFGQQVLAARRMVERGVRFVQIFHGEGAAGAWDAHSALKSNHTSLCAQVDKPIAGLLTDLRRRGLLDETIVVWSTEFGRTPCAQGADGRDHHNYGFSVWMAGGGIRGGTVHGATDELGFHAVEHRHYVTDVHATVMHLLGLNSHELEVPGRKRLDIEHGQTIREILA